MTTRHNRYGAEDLARPEEIVDRLRRVLGPLARRQAAFLHQMVLLLPDHAASFKSARPAARPSELIRALERTHRNPVPMTKALVSAEVTRDEAWHVVDTNATAVILLYHYARMIWGGAGSHDRNATNNANSARPSPRPMPSHQIAATETRNGLAHARFFPGACRSTRSAGPFRSRS